MSRSFHWKSYHEESRTTLKTSLAFCTIVPPEVRCDTKMYQIYFRPGLRPETPGELTTLLHADPIVGWAGEYRLPIPASTRRLRCIDLPPILTTDRRHYGIEVQYLGMLTGWQDFVTLGTLEAQRMPVFTQRRLLLRYNTPHHNI